MPNGLLEVAYNWAYGNTMLIATVALVLMGAIIDYNALPLLIVRYLKLSGGDLSRSRKYGQVTIALMVGIYTWLALIFNHYAWSTAAKILIIWLVADALFSLWTLFRKT